MTNYVIINSNFKLLLIIIIINGWLLNGKGSLEESMKSGVDTI